MMHLSWIAVDFLRLILPVSFVPWLLYCNASGGDDLTYVVIRHFPKYLEELRHSKEIRDIYSLAMCSILCSADESCTTGVFDPTADRCYFYSDYFCPEPCQEVYNYCPYPCDGVYTLTIGNPSQQVPTYCVFFSGIGWTVIQRRLDGSVDFYRNWTDYVTGFGNVEGEYWLGLNSIQQLTMTNQKLYVYLEDHEGEVRFAKFSHFSIDDESTNYTLKVSGYSGTAGNSLTGHNGFQFSTKDRDNDVWGSSCAVTFVGAWWYSACHSSNLNGIWYPGGKTNSYATGAVWSVWKSYYYSLKTIYMMISR